MNDRRSGFHARRSGTGGKRLDVFSDVLRVMRLAGGVFLEAEFTAPWCLNGKIPAEACKPFQVMPKNVIATHFVAEGSMKLQVEGGEAIDVHAGELVLLPHNHVHSFGSHLDATLVPAQRLMKSPQLGSIMRIQHGGGGEVTQLLCGFLGTETSFAPLLTALPPVLKLNLRKSSSGAWMESSFRFAVSEIAAGRMGSATVIAKLSELLFVEAVSQYVATLPDERRGWLAGLRDAQIGRALGLLHAQPAHAWTAELLATEAGMSRSVFAERFALLVGQPPMQYLALWRMHLAAQRLRESQSSVAQIAFTVGYDSEAAFSRAFKRQFGASPGQWRKRSTTDQADA